MNRLPNARVLARPLLIACLAVSLGTMGGCFIPALIGGMAESYAETANHTVEAEYTGLQGKTFAIVVTADRSIEASFPALVPAVTQRMFDYFYKSGTGTGGIAPAQSLAFLYNNPRWLIRPRSELAKELGVDRIVDVEIQEFRLNDPGNSYLWEGVAMGTVGVIELESPTPDLYTFEKHVMVKFPDKSGMGPNELKGAVVRTELMRRFVDRCAWPFFTHEEKMRPDY